MPTPFEISIPASAMGWRRRAGMTASVCCVMTAFVFAAEVAIADLGNRGGPEPSNIDGITELLRQDPYDMELLISFGTSTGGSAGHLALGIRDEVSGDDRVYSANFYADRARKHEIGFYTDDLMISVPKKEYLFKTVSSLGETAAFGLDFGEIYKRSVIGVRVYGVPAEEKEAVRAYFRRINADFHHQVKNTEYHDGEIKYDYMRLNCAKTIGSAFKFGVGYENLEVTSAKLLTRRRIVVAAKANIPTEMAMKLIREWNRRGYGMDVVLYKKYGGSTHVDPNEEEKVAFKDLPNRFPSVLSRDFRRKAGAYEDFDNLFAMYLLYNMGKYSVRVNEQTHRLEIEKEKIPMAYPEAAELATRSARSDSKNFLLRLPFLPLGTMFGEAADNTHLYNFTSEGDNK
ncbi:MAG: hypothetical protein JNM42_11560 [Propionivibrio sp.]|uniref:hypothetical protein n=1 Tax=Propionivibrio sp. TaxID=2212460 RepID=UPI001A62ADC5|nr:hypothetical protein [Propionivibrio sp.]MBL8415063.1 hypothetical protein [Propionivibrio sp.]